MADLVKVHSIPGWQAEMFRIFLESLDFEVMVVQESVGQTIGFTMGTLGTAHIYARAEDAEAVQETIRKMDAGEYELGWWSMSADANTDDLEQDEA